MITSLSNPKVKQAAALEQRKTRRETGLFVAEGVNLLDMARALKWTPQTVFYRAPSPLVSWARAAGAECFECAEVVLSKLSTKDNPQDIVGVFEQRWGRVEDVRNGVWVVLEEVRDPGNLGTIIRTADAVGSSGVVLVGNCCDPYSREAVRASMGSVFAVPLVRAVQLGDVAGSWRGEVVGTHLSATEDFRRSYADSVLLVMGSEGPGLSDAAASLCRPLVRIPMQGHAESLNLAAATALMLYEIRRQRL